MTYLQSLLAEAMGLASNDPRVIAAVKAIYKAKVVDDRAVTRAQIRADKETDYKILARRYHCSPQTVYRSWSEILPSMETR
jgi:hypothetical protein